MHTVVATSQRIAGGDLQGGIAGDGRDEVGQLARLVGEMQESLRMALVETRDNAERITKTSGSLACNVGQLEQGAVAQAEAASSIAASIEQLTVSISHISAATDDASRLAGESDRLAESCKSTIDVLIGEIQNVAVTEGDASQQVSALADQSQKISQLFSVIKEIADQTNLLVLNAAVEAARASAYARETGSAIVLIQGKAREVATVIAGTADGLREQTMSATEVARRVEQIAAYAEESSSATASTAD